MKRGGEQQPVGPSPEDVQRANASRGRLKGPGLGFWGKTVDIVGGIALLGAGGLGLKSAAESASQKPPQTTPDQRGPNPPPEGVRLSPPPDSSAPSTFRVLLPQVTNKYQEAPLRILREFGNLETDKVLFINRGEKAWVEMGDPELYQNLLKIRDEYSFHPDLKRRIYFYETYEQLRDTSGVPYDPNKLQIWQWGAYVRQIPIFDDNNQFVGRRDYPPTFKDGEIRWQTTSDGAIEFHISLPEPLPGVLPASEQITYLNIVALDERLPLLKFLFSGPEGPYDGMADKYLQAVNSGANPQTKYPLVKAISRHDYNLLFPVKLVYKEPPSK